MSDNKRIAKNTIFLYIRMLLVMVATLYASRVALDKLGVDDFGLYNVVFSVVTMLTFISGTLSFGTSRFITFELGAGNNKKLRLTFSTALCANVVIAILLLVALETIGLWFVYNKLVIPAERFSAALIVYQISLVTMFFNFLQIPYRSDIIAHEKMGVYAYVSIFEALGRLAVCYLITIGPFDKLVNYAFFWASVQVVTACLYIFYSVRKFDEAGISMKFNKDILKNILGFSGWNIAANMGETFKLQGILILMNMFFQPVVVGAQALANQIAAGIMQFVGNFRTAIDPQVIKLYAAGDFAESKRLTLSTAVYTFDLILLLALPCLFMMNTILELWLVEVPEYCVIFAQWTVIQRIPCAIDGTFFTPMVASGKIKRNALFSLAFCIAQLVILVVLFRLGAGVMWVQYIGFIAIMLFTFFVKPFILYKDVDYGIKEMVLCFWDCVKVLVPSVVLSWLVYTFIGEMNMWHAMLSFALIMVAVIISSLVFMNVDDRKKLLLFVRSKVTH